MKREPRRHRYARRALWAFCATVAVVLALAGALSAGDGEARDGT